MGFATTIEHTALTIHPRLLDECVRIWALRDYKGEPPDPYHVLNISEASRQVLTWAEIVRFYTDEQKRKRVGAT